MKQCGKCKRIIEEPAGGAAQALFGGFSLSESLEYACKSCGTVYCLDCMSALKKQGGICPKCGKSIGW